MSNASSEPDAPRRRLSLLDAVSLIVGVVIGAGIYKTTPMIAACAPSVPWLLLVWTAGGAVALIGAMCYAELATTYPQEGGDYVYLTRAYGRRMGFVFSWAVLWVVSPGSIGFVAYVFAEYANQLFPLDDGKVPGVSNATAQVVYAAGAIFLLSMANLLGLRGGKLLQNTLSAAKVLGLLGIFAVALLTPPASEPWRPDPNNQMAPNLYLAMIFVLLTYGGWNDMSYVAAEVRQPHKNLLRALLLGTFSIAVLYLLVNLAFIRVLGLAGVQNSQAVAADAVAAGLGDWGGRAISALICVSCLGAINAMIFTVARVYYAVGKQHRLFAFFAHWNRRRDAPTRALLLQMAVTLAVAVGFGLQKHGFRRIVDFTTPVFWFFFLLVGLSLFVLRVKDRHLQRPYRVHGYPFTPVLFCLSCLFMLYASLSYAYEQASWEAGWSIGLLLLGVALSFFESGERRNDE